MTSRRLGLVALLVFPAACSGSEAANESTSATQTTSETGAPPITTTPTTTPTTTVTPAATTPSESTVPETTEPVPELEAWAPVGFGPFEVGVATIVIEDPDGIRPLTVDVWFPLDGGVDSTTLAPQ